MDDSTVMVTIVLWIVLLEYVLVRALSNFAARKLCHAGCGLGIMLLDSNSAAARYFVWSVASSSIMMTWKLSPLPAFRFSRPGDVGITIYLLLVSAWFYAELSPLILAPVFFADPAGAVVGKWCSRNLAAYNPVCYGSKTVLGSLAVFAVTWLTITYSCSPAARLLIAAAACVAEAVADEQRAEAHLLATKAKATLAIETPYIARHVRVNHEAKRRAAVEEALWRHEQMAAKVREEDLKEQQASFTRTLTSELAHIPADASPAVPESPGGASPRVTISRLASVLSPAA